MWKEIWKILLLQLRGYRIYPIKWDDFVIG